MNNTAVMNTNSQLIFLPNEVFESNGLQLVVRSSEWSHLGGSSVLFEIKNNRSALNQTETPEEKEAFDVIAKDNESAEVKVVESDYDKGMRKAMQKIAVSCGRVFGGNIGYEDLPDLVDLLINTPKPKHTKEEYVRVEDAIFDLREEYCSGQLKFNDGTYEKPKYETIIGITELAHHLLHNNVFRKVVTELTEREAFIDQCKEILEEYSAHKSEFVFGKIYDELVEGE